MNKPVFSGPPTPEEFQRQLAEYMRQHFQRAGAQPATETTDAGGAESGGREAKANQFEFSYKPREVKDYLDRFVIKQDEAKKVLSVALCDHYHHVRMALEGKESPNYAKQNIILLGPTGVGKTFLIRCAADLIGVPFVKADATKFSETGYVGGDVEDMVRDLVRLADGDVTRPNTASSTLTRSTRSPPPATRRAATSAGAACRPTCSSSWRRPRCRPARPTTSPARSRR